MLFCPLSCFVFVADFPGARPESLKAYLKRRWEIDVIFVVFCTFWGPGGTPKSMKIRPGDHFGALCGPAGPHGPPELVFLCILAPFGGPFWTLWGSIFGP